MLEPDRNSPTAAGASIFFLTFVFPLAPPTPETLLSFLLHKEVEEVFSALSKNNGRLLFPRLNLRCYISQDALWGLNGWL